MRLADRRSERNGGTLTTSVREDLVAGDLRNPSTIYREAVEAPQRVLIDWDFSAHGIWKILSPAEQSAPLPPGGTWGPAPAEITRPRPWSDRLSSALLDELQEWNDTGEVLLGRRQSSQVTDPQVDAFCALAAELAELRPAGTRIRLRGPPHHPERFLAVGSSPITAPAPTSLVNCAHHV